MQTLAACLSDIDGLNVLSLVRATKWKAENAVLSKGYRAHGIKRRSSSFNTERVDHLYEDPHNNDPRFRMHYGDLTDATKLREAWPIIATPRSARRARRRGREAGFFKTIAESYFPARSRARTSGHGRSHHPGPRA